AHTFLPPDTKANTGRLILGFVSTAVHRTEDPGVYKGTISAYLCESVCVGHLSAVFTKSHHLSHRLASVGVSFCCYVLGCSPQFPQYSTAYDPSQHTPRITFW
ncbi:unnamed protein product, partial [Ectocarpus sp. 12 AP-2014]